MKYVILVKQVPDTTRIKVDENGNLIRQGVPSILDPYCEYALDMVCRIRKPEDSVIVVSMGPPQAKESIFRCLELGANEAYLLSDKAFAGADVFATSRTLTAFIRKFAADYDLIFCGKQAADGDTAEVPAETAAMLNVQQFCYSENIIISDTIKVTQNYNDEIRVCTVPKGSVLSVSIGDINRRVPSISDHIKALNIEIKTLDRIALGLGMYSVGIKGSKTKIESSYSPRYEHSGKIIDGTDPSEAAKLLIKEVL
ncbi:MAG: electron transfer flavoprotein subunit beta/FixA family protein [Candidatus Methanomethylophilaceae archaeon]|nr:electron transfer flavoprotein subunit beta/FixA family protein [Candidatus Methanomethylophilaceae archaeon]MDD3378558.1 electron transfer flavoprotein subunit beta/FixA family protein [Candidatus Methanomethylophilaceae archaeon]MDY0224465.1 electron transfer flavoprotein subunit beta/FixA family protein [Candidatus Methanomethylophilaceae archaeon]